MNWKKWRGLTTEKSHLLPGPSYRSWCDWFSFLTNQKQHTCVSLTTFHAFTWPFISATREAFYFWVQHRRHSASIKLSAKSKNMKKGGGLNANFKLKLELAVPPPDEATFAAFLYFALILFVYIFFWLIIYVFRWFYSWISFIEREAVRLWTEICSLTKMEFGLSLKVKVKL